MGNVQDHSNHQSPDSTNKNIQKSVLPLQVKESCPNDRRSTLMSDPDSFTIYRTKSASYEHDSSLEYGSSNDETVPQINDTFTEEALPELVTQLDEFYLSTPKNKNSKDNKLINQVFNKDKVEVEHVTSISNNSCNEVISTVNENDSTLENLSDFTNTFETVRENSVQSSAYNSINNDTLGRESSENVNSTNNTNSIKDLTLNNQTDNFSSEISFDFINQSDSVTTSTSTENSLDGNFLVTNTHNNFLNQPQPSKNINNTSLITSVMNNNINLEYGNVSQASNNSVPMDSKTINNISNALDVTHNLINNNVSNNESQMKNVLPDNINKITNYVKDMSEDLVTSNVNTSNTSVDVSYNKNSTILNPNNSSNEIVSSFSNFVEQLNNKQTTIKEPNEANSTPNVHSITEISSILIFEQNIPIEKTVDTSVNRITDIHLTAVKSESLNEEISENNSHKSINLNKTSDLNPLNDMPACSSSCVKSEVFENKLSESTDNSNSHQDPIEIHTSPKTEINANSLASSTNLESSVKPIESTPEQNNLNVCRENDNKCDSMKVVCTDVILSGCTEISDIVDKTENKINTSVQEYTISINHVQPEIENAENSSEIKQGLHSDTFITKLNESVIVSSDIDVKLSDFHQNDKCENQKVVNNDPENNEDKNISFNAAINSVSVEDTTMNLEQLEIISLENSKSLVSNQDKEQYENNSITQNGVKSVITSDTVMHKDQKNNNEDNHLIQRNDQENATKHVINVDLIKDDIYKIQKDKSEIMPLDNNTTLSSSNQENRQCDVNLIQNNLLRNETENVSSSDDIVMNKVLNEGMFKVELNKSEILTLNKNLELAVLNCNENNRCEEYVSQNNLPLNEIQNVISSEVVIKNDSLHNSAHDCIIENKVYDLKSSVLASLNSNLTNMKENNGSCSQNISNVNDQNCLQNTVEHMDAVSSVIVSNSISNDVSRNRLDNLSTSKMISSSNNVTTVQECNECSDIETTMNDNLMEDNLQSNIDYVTSSNAVENNDVLLINESKNSNTLFVQNLEDSMSISSQSPQFIVGTNECYVNNNKLANDILTNEVSIKLVPEQENNEIIVESTSQSSNNSHIIENTCTNINLEVTENRNNSNDFVQIDHTLDNTTMTVLENKSNNITEMLQNGIGNKLDTLNKCSDNIYNSANVESVLGNLTEDNNRTEKENIKHLDTLVKQEELLNINDRTIENSTGVTDLRKSEIIDNDNKMNNGNCDTNEENKLNISDQLQHNKIISNEIETILRSFDVNVEMNIENTKIDLSKPNTSESDIINDFTEKLSKIPADYSNIKEELELKQMCATKETETKHHCNEKLIESEIIKTNIPSKQSDNSPNNLCNLSSEISTKTLNNANQSVKMFESQNITPSVINLKDQMRISENSVKDNDPLEMTKPLTVHETAEPSSTEDSNKKVELEKVFEELIHKTEDDESDEQFVSGDLFKNPDDFDIFFKVSNKSNKNKTIDKRQSKLSLLKQFDPFFERPSVVSKPLIENSSECTFNSIEKSIAANPAIIVPEVENVEIKELKNELPATNGKTVLSQDLSDIVNSVKVPQMDIPNMEPVSVQMEECVVIDEPTKIVPENINLNHDIKETSQVQKLIHSPSHYSSHDQKPLIETKSPAKIDSINNFKLESKINVADSSELPFINIDERLKNRKIEPNCNQVNTIQTNNQCLQTPNALHDQAQIKTTPSKLINYEINMDSTTSTEPLLTSNKIMSETCEPDTFVSSSHKGLILNQLETASRSDSPKISDRSQKKKKLASLDLDTVEGRIIHEIQSMIMSDTFSKSAQIMKLNKLKEYLVDQFNDYNGMVERLTRNENSMKNLTEQNFNSELLQIELNKAQDKIEKLTGVVSQFECIANELSASNEVLKSERNTALSHLASAESAFTDVHSKFERSKKIIEEMHYNEKVMKEAYKDLNKALEVSEQKYIAFKKHVVDQINLINKQVIEKKMNYETEILRLKTSIRRLELHNQSLQGTLEQKTIEAKELESICDNLTSKLCGKALR